MVKDNLKFVEVSKQPVPSYDGGTYNIITYWFFCFDWCYLQFLCSWNKTRGFPWVCKTYQHRLQQTHKALHLWHFFWLAGKKIKLLTLYVWMHDSTAGEKNSAIDKRLAQAGWYQIYKNMCSLPANFRQKWVLNLSRKVKGNARICLLRIWSTNQSMHT